MTEEKTQKTKGVEEFWRARVKYLSTVEADRISLAYRRHIIGSMNYEYMHKVHAGAIPAKEDYLGFYSDIRDILKPTEEELETLISEGFNFAGLIGLIDDNTLSPEASQITINMMAAK